MYWSVVWFWGVSSHNDTIYQACTVMTMDKEAITSIHYQFFWLGQLGCPGPDSATPRSEPTCLMPPPPPGPPHTGDQIEVQINLPGKRGATRIAIPVEVAPHPVFRWEATVAGDLRCQSGLSECPELVITQSSIQNVVWGTHVSNMGSTSSASVPTSSRHLP